MLLDLNEKIMYRNKLTPEEALEAIKLRMKYDAKLTLDENKSLVSEQGLTKNQQLAINFGYGPVSAQYADQLAKQGKFVGKVEGNTSMFPKVGNPTTSAPTAAPAPYSSMFPNSNQQFKVGTPTPSAPAAAPAPYSSMFPNSNQQFKVGTPTPAAPASAPASPPAPVKPPKTTVPFIPKGLNDVKGVQEFQKWLDSTQGDWAWSPRLQKKYKVEGKSNRGFGKFGPSTEKFWNNPDIRKQYMDFKEGKTPASPAASTTPSTTTTSNTSTTPTTSATSIPSIQPPKTPPQAQIKPTKDVAAKKFAEFAMNQGGTPATPVVNTTTKVVANKDTDF